MSGPLHGLARAAPPPEVFENEWRSFRTRRDRDLELKSASQAYAKPGRYVVAVKVIDIFGNDTMTFVRMKVG